ncbi:Protein argonaute MEL1 [Pseudocercospora fuligena]|uniref:Protein argonaute MEL1 n=1 Tax=Pseudocercospora fuligena TaxID=685502 RepID=A0A8H6RBB3_9PEZI|nr:Protein argonaute MEL1 [Pseudocercospora fuligena]
MGKKSDPGNCPRCPGYAEGDIYAKAHLKGGISGLSKCQSEHPLGSEGFPKTDIWWGFSSGDVQNLEAFQARNNLTSVEDCKSFLEHVLQLSNDYCKTAKEQTSDVAEQEKYINSQKAGAQYQGQLITKPMLEHAVRIAFPVQEKKKAIKAKAPASAAPVAGSSKAAGQATASTGMSDYKNLPAALNSINLNATGPAPSQPTAQSQAPVASAATTSALSSGSSNGTQQGVAQQSSSSNTSTSQATQLQVPNSTTPAPVPQQQQQAGPIGALRTRVQTQQTQNNALRVFTNSFAINQIHANRILHEYQLTGLTGHNPDLGRSKKKALINRFITQSQVLPANRNTFVVNGEGRVIAWQDLAPGSAFGATIEQQNVDDFDRAQVNVASRQLGMNLVYERMINIDDVFRYATGNSPRYAIDVAETALNILFGRAVDDSGTGVWQIGDNHFFTPAAATPLGPGQQQNGSWGLDAIRGFSSHIKARDGRVLLNVNTALSAFYRPGITVDAVIRSICAGNYPGAFLNSQTAKSHLIGVRVRIRYNRDKPGETSRKDTADGRLKTITGFSTRPAKYQMFTDSNGTPVSVYQHFRNTYPTQAQAFLASGQLDPQGDQFCVNTGDTDPSHGRESWFLADMLEIVESQIFRKTLDAVGGAGNNLTANMISIACQQPHVNRTAIVNNGLPALGFVHGRPDPARLTSAGLQLARPMMMVPIRQIPIPTVRYGGGRSGDQSRGPGKWSTRKMLFLTSNKPISGRVSLFCPPGGLLHQNHHDAYRDGLREAWSLNLSNPPKTPPVAPNARFQSLPAMDVVQMKQPLEAPGIGLLVLCLPANNSIIRRDYAKFRIVADQVVGRPSLVICEERMLGSLGKGPNTGGRLNGKALIPYFANNMAKVNTRLGNQNHTVADVFGSLSANGQCDTLVLGADLIHPKGNSSEVTPTIASVVGSTDGTFATFLGSSRRMPPLPPGSPPLGREYIATPQMISMVEERIRAWQSKNNRLPSRILYYRDGTGESQYRFIHGEVRAIRTAYGNVAGGPQFANNLPVTAVVAVKRHTTRFYPQPNAQARAANGRPAERTFTGNCVPGTVVDSQITSPYYFDFYLQSHDVEQGSAKPTHYFVLENGMGFSEHQLQDLTNAFCYNFSHSTSAVSYASPAFYADRLCERAMLYLDSHYNNWPTVQAMTSNTVRQTDIDNCWGRHGRVNRQNPWHPNFDNVMFWM